MAFILQRMGLHKTKKSQPKQKVETIDSGFDLKCLTYVISSPEEVFSTLIDEKLRDQWDLRVKTVTKETDTCLKITYASTESLIETVKYNCYQDGESMII